MSLINGLSAFGAELASFARNARKDEEADARASLLNGASARAPTESNASLESTPGSDRALAAPASAAALPGPRMPSGANPYDGPHAAALWQAERAIMGPESGGKADAQNPVSSAGGLFQIINGTWDGAIQKMGLPVASSDTERDIQKYQPVLNTAVMRHINAEAAATLDAAGLPVNVETLKAAHRLGPAGAATAIKAAMTNPDAPLVGNGLAADAVRGNGDIAHLSVSEFLANPYRKDHA